MGVFLSKIVKILFRGDVQSAVDTVRFKEGIAVFLRFYIAVRSVRMNCQNWWQIRPLLDCWMPSTKTAKKSTYYRVIRQWPQQQIASFRGQMDKNIRKVFTATIG